MPNYRRAFVPGGCWFFTVNLLERRDTLLVDRIDALRESMERARGRYPFVIDAVVVLPDHLHAVLTLPPGDADFSLRWRLIKSRLAEALLKQEPLSDVRRARGERGIWQPDFGSTSSGMRRITPATPHSSFHRDVRAGIFPADWAGEVEQSGEFGESA